MNGRRRCGSVGAGFLLGTQGSLERELCASNRRVVSTCLVCPRQRLRAGGGQNIRSAMEATWAARSRHRCAPMWPTRRRREYNATPSRPTAVVSGHCATFCDGDGDGAGRGWGRRLGPWNFFQCRPRPRRKQDRAHALDGLNSLAVGRGSTRPMRPCGVPRENKVCSSRDLFSSVRPLTDMMTLVYTRWLDKLSSSRLRGQEGEEESKKSKKQKTKNKTKKQE